MKEKWSFFLNNTHSDMDRLVNIIGCIEEVESVFGIEFAAGVEDRDGVQTIIFGSDYLFTEEEDMFLDKYDGEVVEEFIRIKETQQIINLNETGCRLDITYDDEYRYTGDEKFTKPKIVTKGLAYPKGKVKAKPKM